MEWAEGKVEFISNLTGTTLSEVSLGSVLAPLCFLSRGLFLVFFHQGTSGLDRFSCATQFLLDFGVVVAPLVLSCTVLSNSLQAVIMGIAGLDLTLLYLLYQTTRLPESGTFFSSMDRFINTRVQSNLVPFVTAFRVLINVKTAISILAVDFSIFPRRYAKTETYGTGVMDFGVGAYVMANAMVCPEARGKGRQGSRVKHVMIQLLAVWPLVLLGFVRLVSVKTSGYHEHVSEYGLHWNFFFTLALVRVAVSLLLTVCPAESSWFPALVLGGLYQLVLETTDLKSFLIHNPHRCGFLQANREGIFSVVGYVSIYLAGVQVGRSLMRQRDRVKDWITVLRNLAISCFGLFCALFVCQMWIEPVSRRMANLSFCVWTVAQSLFFLLCFGVADLLLLYSKTTSNFTLVSSSWTPCLSAKPEEERESKSVNDYCLIQAVSRNQLVYFLLANVLTGLTNVLIDTLNCSDLQAVIALLLYMFINCSVIFILHVNKITLKFW